MALYIYDDIQAPRGYYNKGHFKVLYYIMLVDAQASKIFDMCDDTFYI